MLPGRLVWSRSERAADRPGRSGCTPIRLTVDTLCFCLYDLMLDDAQRPDVRLSLRWDERHAAKRSAGKRQSGKERLKHKLCACRGVYVQISNDEKVTAAAPPSKQRPTDKSS